MVRLLAIGLLQTGLVIALICFGTLLLHAGLFILLPWTVQTKAILGILLGATYIVIGGIALRRAMDEGTWMDRSGATKMLEETMVQSRQD